MLLNRRFFLLFNSTNEKLWCGHIAKERANKVTLRIEFVWPQTNERPQNIRKTNSFQCVVFFPSTNQKINNFFFSSPKAKFLNFFLYEYETDQYEFKW